MATYDTLGPSYNELIARDPLKVYTQFPYALKALKKVKGKRILDIGCGNGTLALALSYRGAEVVGFDISERQIQLAQSFADQHRQKIRYVCSTPSSFMDKQLFDKAVAVLVLPYARNRKELQTFYECAYNNLKNRGTFISLTIVPSQLVYDKPAYNRIYSKQKNKKIKITYLYNDGRKWFTTTLNGFTKKDYEVAARKAGFTSLTWEVIKPTREGIGALGKQFWETFVKSQPYQALIAKK